MVHQYHAQDDICLRFLKENPNRIEMFESFPNWIELIKKKK
jgi:hypothetical protein